MDRGIWCCEYQVTVDLGTIRSRQAKCGLDQRAYKGLLKKGEMAIYLGRYVGPGRLRYADNRLGAGRLYLHAAAGYV